MKSFIKKFQAFTAMMDGLKYNDRALLWIILIDLSLGLSSTVVDWQWLIRVPRHLVMFAPICSIYPWLLAVWMTIFFFRKKVSSWFTTFLLIGLFSYGIMAWIYFPLYMSWNGVNFHDIGSMFWVTAYASQAFIIASEIQKVRWYTLAPIMAYFFFKDYADRFLGTFLDILLDSYPENLKTIFTVSVVTLHVLAIPLVFWIQKRNHQKHAEPAKIPLTRTSHPKHILAGDSVNQ